MATAQPTAVPTTKSPIWKPFLFGLFTLLACIALAASLLAAWAQPLIFNTDHWVSVVTPLSKNSAVVSAVSTDTVTALFSSANVQSRIQDALPPKTTFLAAPLTSQLQTYATGLATKLVQSDQFQNVWILSNRTAHDQLVAIITNQPSSSPGVSVGKIQLNLSDITSLLQQRLGASGQQLFGGLNTSSQSQNSASLPIKQHVRAIRNTANLINDLHAVLPAITVALFLSALVFAHRWSRAIVVFGLGVAITAAILLIVLKAGKPELVQMAKTSLNQQAVAAVWDRLVAPLQGAGTTAIWVGLIIAVLGVLAGPYRWAVNFRAKLGAERLGKSAFASWVQQARGFIANYKGWFYGVGVAAALLGLLIASSITWVTIVTVVAILVIYSAIVALLAERPIAAGSAAAA